MLYEVLLLSACCQIAHRKFRSWKESDYSLNFECVGYLMLYYQVLRRHGDIIKRTVGGHLVVQGRADDTMNLGGIKVPRRSQYLFLYILLTD
jgi:hypothetical protein